MPAAKKTVARTDVSSKNEPVEKEPEPTKKAPAKKTRAPAKSKDAASAKSASKPTLKKEPTEASTKAPAKGKNAPAPKAPATEKPVKDETPVKSQRKPKAPKARRISHPPPKRPISTYLLFCQDERSDPARLARYGDTLTDQTRALAAQWKSFSEPQKRQYVERYEKSCVVFRDAVRAYIREYDAHPELRHEYDESFIQTQRKRLNM